MQSLSFVALLVHHTPPRQEQHQMEPKPETQMQIAEPEQHQTQRGQEPVHQMELPVPQIKHH